jgi:hypothetical protein
MREYIVTINRSDHPESDALNIWAKDRDEAIKYVKNAYRKVLVKVLGAALKKDTTEGNDETQRVAVHSGA